MRDLSASPYRLAGCSATPASADGPFAAVALVGEDISCLHPLEEGLQRLLDRSVDVLAPAICLAASAPKRAACTLISTGEAWCFLFAKSVGQGLTLLRFIDRGKPRPPELLPTTAMAAMLDAATDAIIAIDANQRIATFNRGAEALLGYTAPEIIGAPLDRLLPAEIREHHRSHVRGYAQETEVGRYMSSRREVVALRKDGSLVPVEATLSRTGTGPDMLMMVFLRDVTERRREIRELEEARRRAEEAVQARTRFLAMMSHELRTPLNAIIGFSDVLGTYGGRAEVRSRLVEYVGYIRESGRHLLGLVNDILDMARLEKGAISIHAEPLELGALVEQVVQLVQLRAQEAGIDLLLHRESDPIAVMGDETRLRQVLLNLLDNALKFTPAGGHVSVEVSLGASDAARIVVADTGVGIPTPALPFVMEPFHQAEAPIRRRREGSGLGLAISKELVALHNGSIEITSEVGVGTRVVVGLPTGGPYGERSPGAR